MRLPVVDDQEAFRTGLRSILEGEWFEVADAPNAEVALECVSRFQPEVVLMDVNCRGMSGIEATRRVLRQAPHTAVVMLSMYEGEELISLALDADASSYLLRDASLDEILSTIQATPSPAFAIARGCRSTPPGYPV